MEKSLSNCPYELSLEQLMQTSVGAKIQQAIEIIHNIQNHYFAIIEKQDELKGFERILRSASLSV